MSDRLQLRDRVSRVHIEYPTVVRQSEELCIEEETRENVQAAIQSATGNILLLGGAGTGKTENALVYCRSFGTLLNGLYGHILVVTSYHSTRENVHHKYMVPAITTHNLLGLSFLGVPKRAEYDLTGVRFIVFEEVLLNPSFTLRLIIDFMRRNSRLRYFATTDARQLQAIDDPLSNDAKVAALKALFSVTITLKKNWRLRTDEDRQWMTKLQEKLDSGPVMDVLKGPCGLPEEQFITLAQSRELGITTGVPFFNCSVAKLDTHFDSYFPHNPNKVKTMGNAKIGSRTYWVGGTLICSKGHLIEHVRGEKIGQALLKPDKSGSMKQTRLPRQSKWRITACSSAERVLTVTSTLAPPTRLSPTTKKPLALTKSERAAAEIEIGFARIESDFKLPYCQTAHAAQGATIEGPYLISDAMSPFLPSGWLNSVLTRTCSRKNVYILKDRLFPAHFLLPQYIQTFAQDMVDGYMEQDALAGRIVAAPREYVTADWILAEYKKAPYCGGCGGYMMVEKNCGRMLLTVNRTDNSLPHLMHSCELMCRGCNCGT